MLTMEIDSLASGYYKVVQAVVKNGLPVSPRGDSTVEIVDFHMTIRDTAYILPIGVGRGVSKVLANEQALQIIAGVDWHKRFKDDAFVSDPKLENYGPLLKPGIERSLSYLAEDLYTRRACANLGHVGGLSGYPCTASLGWMYRGKKLHAFVTMRSNDVWLGLPYDAYMFAVLQRSMADYLGVEPGPMHWHARSMHVYDRHKEKASNLVPGGYIYKTMVVPGKTWNDKRIIAKNLLCSTK